jgi:hypothetical protein
VGAQTSGRWMNGVIRGTARHEVWAGLRTIPRHRHHKPYAAVIFSGGYEESGSYGRYRVKAGQVLLHRSFDAHLDRFERSGARVLNLPLDQEPVFGLGRVDDPDAIARLAATDLFAARAVLKQQLLPAHVSVDDWPDLLARDLLADPRLRLDDWAERHHLAASPGYSLRRRPLFAPRRVRKSPWRSSQRALRCPISQSAPVSPTSRT